MTTPVAACCCSAAMIVLPTKCTAAVLAKRCSRVTSLDTSVISDKELLDREGGSAVLLKLIEKAGRHRWTRSICSCRYLAGTLNAPPQLGVHGAYSQLTDAIVELAKNSPSCR